VFERRSQRQGIGKNEKEVIEENEAKMLEIVEFSCTYGRISHERDTLEFTYQQKKSKYEGLSRQWEQSICHG
jgi:hypothetical protein